MPSYTNYNDEELLKHLSAGNRQAYVEIYKRYHSLLFLYAFRKLQDREEAKDVVQDVFIRLWNKRETLELSGSFTGYLYRSVRNRALNIFAHKHVEQEYLESLESFLNEHHHAADYLVRERQIRELIEREISLLPPKMRQIFELSRKSNLSYKEIAEKLSISEHTVATQVKRALKILREKLGSFVFLFIFVH